MVYELKNVTVSYGEGQVALQNVHCTISDGKWIAIVGQTGAGKSTFVQVVKGLVPFEGDVWMNGQRVQRDQKGNVQIVKEVGYVFQYPEHQLFETTVYKELAFGLHHQGYKEADIKQQIMALLPKMKIDESMLQLPPFQLSGGQKRRVAIASILLMKPKLLIVDEPTAGLDPVSHHELLQLLKQWQIETDGTILFVTHQMEDVADYADEVIVIHNGRLNAHMETNMLFLQHAHLIEEASLQLPEQVRLLRLVEQLSGEAIMVDSCKEEVIFQAVYPLLRGEQHGT